MKSLFRQLLRLYLKLICLLVLAWRRPIVIAVAGSANKYFIEKEIKDFLLAQGETVRSSPKNFNTEIGLPLAILDLPSGYNSFRRWLPVIRQAFMRLFERSYPRFLVVSLGSSDPGDMRYLLSIVRPRIAIVSDITQRYLEGFSGLDEFLGEYSDLARSLRPDSFLILNADNQRVFSLSSLSRARALSFGESEQADCRLISAETRLDGQFISYAFEGETRSELIKRFGRHHVRARLIRVLVATLIQEDKLYLANKK